MITFRLPPFLHLIAAAFLLSATVLIPRADAGSHQAKARAHRPTASQTADQASVSAGSRPMAPLAVAGVPAPPALPEMASYVLMDAETGSVIAAKAPDKEWPPASLTKLMTAFLTYQAVAHGALKMDQTVPISDAAWHTGGSRMFISPAMSVTVDQLLHGLIIDSGNDAAVALAQAVAGNRAAFVTMMNAEARKLGLKGSHYLNADGLPAPHLQTTAMDVATLSRAILSRYPQFLKISAEQYYTFDKIRQRSWNPVLFKDPTVDGLKTGRTNEAGHSIDATALRHGRRLIAVVLGGPSWVVSSNAIEALLDYGYRFYTNKVVTKAKKPVGTLHNVMFDPETIPVGAARTVTVTIPIVAPAAPKTILALDPPPSRGIAAGTKVGTITVSVGGRAFATVPVVTLTAAKRAGIITRLLRRMHKML